MIGSFAYLMSPFHYGNDGYMGTNPHFDAAVVRHRDGRKEWLDLCIGTLDNCRVMWRKGMKGHTPLVDACGGNGSYYFCKPRGARGRA